MWDDRDYRSNSSQIFSYQLEFRNQSLLLSQGRSKDAPKTKFWYFDLELLHESHLGKYIIHQRPFRVSLAKTKIRTKNSRQQATSSLTRFSIL